jgi:hypothetical protein
MLQGDLLDSRSHFRLFFGRSPRDVARLPDFLARLRSIYGEKPLRVSGAELVAEDRNRY